MNNKSKIITAIILIILSAISTAIYFKYFHPQYNDWAVETSPDGERLALVRMVAPRGKREYKFQIWTFKTDGSSGRRLFRVPDEYTVDMETMNPIYWINDELFLIVRDKRGFRAIYIINSQTGKARLWSQGFKNDLILGLTSKGALTARYLHYNNFYLLFRPFGKKNFTKLQKVITNNPRAKSAISSDGNNIIIIESYHNSRTNPQINNLLTIDRSSDKTSICGIDDMLIYYPRWIEAGKKLVFIAKEGLHTLNFSGKNIESEDIKIPGNFRIYYSYDKNNNMVYIPTDSQDELYVGKLKRAKFDRVKIGVPIMPPVKISPDGKHLFFISYDNDRNCNLYSFNLKERKLVELTKNEFGKRHLTRRKMRILFDRRQYGIIISKEERDKREEAK
ncbi:MAG: hypothetical protein K8T10_06305 [Candidatus Eremiobacteraeota bacterium]|nr:hypothetical protein [Candidatus Eremiobacteraeota bacterium]